MYGPARGAIGRCSTSAHPTTLPPPPRHHGAASCGRAGQAWRRGAGGSLPAMGTWGAGIFSDDLASDVRESWRDLLATGVPAEEATARVEADYASSLSD